MSRRIVPTIGFGLLLLVSIRADGASFNCAKAHRGAEALICANEDLSKADDRIVDAYHRAHGALAGIDKESKRAQKRLEDEQKDWIKKRNKCGDVDCLRTEYQSRMAALQSYYSQPASSQPTPEIGSAPTRPAEPTLVPTTDPGPPSGGSTPSHPAAEERKPDPEGTGGERAETKMEPEHRAAEATAPLTSAKRDEPPTQAPERTPATVSEAFSNKLYGDGSWADIIKAVLGGAYTVVVTIAVALYVLWGAYWGCQIVYPRMMAWYNSTTWFIVGKGPMDILMRQIAFGLQIRFWAVVIGTIVGCLGGAVYMHFVRRRSSEAA